MTDRLKIGFGLICAGLLLLVCGCRFQSDGYRHHVSLENEMWSLHQTLPFEFEIRDTVSPYQLSLYFRYTDDYPYQDVYLFLQTTFPDGNYSEDTLHADLFTSEGKPLGKGHRVKELDVPYGLLKFPQKGKYVMRFIHAMRTDTLQGVCSFGISLDEQSVK